MNAIEWVKQYNEGTLEQEEYVLNGVKYPVEGTIHQVSLLMAEGEEAEEIEIDE